MKESAYYKSFFVGSIMLWAMMSEGQDATVVTPSAYGQGVKRNYIRTWEPIAPLTDPNSLSLSTGLQQSKIATQYLDGLGRNLQMVVKQGSYVSGGSAVDLVSPSVYDEFGREVRKYLPFAANTSDGIFKMDPFQQQLSFYSDNNSNSPIKGQGETFYYSKSEFEASPLYRVDRTYAPGNSWVHDGNGINMKYWVNTDADNVRIWNVNDNPEGFATYTSPAAYGAGSLYKNVVVGEDGKQIIEFKDKQEKIILKKVQLTAIADDGTGRDHTGWLCTYYLYDDLNNLRCVIQPKGVELISPTWSLTDATILAEQCFRYEYDDRNRMIIKKVPGAAEVYMVYDARDRLVMTQDGNLRNAQPYPKWLFTLFDNLNRPVKTGTISTVGSFADHRTAAYTSTSYPNIDNYINEIYTEIFYDNYDWLNSNGNPFSQNRYTFDDGIFFTSSNDNFPYPQSLTQSFNTKGMATGTKTKVLGSSQYLYAINYYDAKGRVIQTQAKNITGCNTISMTQYSFSGQVLANYEITNDCNASFAQGVLTKYEYDDLFRVATVKKTVYTSTGVGNVAEKVVAQNEYDALGQLKKKKLAPAYNSGAGMETLNYDYNIRGWTLGANRDYAKDANNNNWFGFDLGYDKANNGIIGNQTYTNPQYNGNIEGMVWKSKGDGEKRKYDFTYDAVNRLTGADFNQYTDGSFNKNASVDFSVNNLSYDMNGNILFMNQKGWKITGSSYIDQLSYTYQTNSNKLAKVNDASSDPNTKLGDFKDGSNGTSDDYNYDVNGNLTLDNNKTISGITYNHLNLPSVITVTGKGTITYTYDATGNKVKKEVNETGQPLRTTLYIGGSVYENDVLQFIGHEEGRIRWNTQTNSFAFDYFLKDHLGNVRMVLTEEQKTDQYPSATLETSTLASEKTFYNISDSRIVNTSDVSGATSYSSLQQKFYETHGNVTGKKTGLAMILKVMAGDVVRIKAESYYNMPGGGPGSYTPMALTDLLDAFTGNSVISTAKGAITPTDINNIAFNASNISNILNRGPQNSNTANAYLNFILFDDQLHYVSCGVDPVAENGGYRLHDIFINYPATASKNGYLYIYVSNENNFQVFFDNLQVSHVRSPLISEDHYYPYGERMFNLSSEALNFGSPGSQNKKYNGIDWQNDLGLNEYDAQLRSLDPQIGRWWQIDPKIEKMEMWSPYASNYDNPILYSDPLGDEGETCCPGNYGALTNAVKRAWNWAAARSERTWEETEKPLLKQGWSNLKGNVTGFAQQAMQNPFSLIVGPAGAVEGAGANLLERSLASTEAKTLINVEVKETPQLLKNVEAGKEGMKAAGVEQNTQRIPSATGTAEYRVPDGLNKTTLTEVKNVSKQSLTNQIKDYMHYADEKGLKFELHVRQDTKLSKPLQQQVDQGKIKLKFIPGQFE